MTTGGASSSRAACPPCRRTAEDVRCRASPSCDTARRAMARLHPRHARRAWCRCAARSDARRAGARAVAAHGAAGAAVHPAACAVRRRGAEARAVAARGDFAARRERDAARLDPLPTRACRRNCCRWSSRSTRLLARLAASIEAQRRFVADAAHELRSPVAALALQIQLAERAHRRRGRAAALGELKLGIARTGAAGATAAQPGPPRARTCRPRRTRRVDLAAAGARGGRQLCARADAPGIDLGVDAPPRGAVHRRRVGAALAESPTWSTTRCAMRPAAAR